jgi:hypothetical protein
MSLFLVVARPPAEPTSEPVGSDPDVGEPSVGLAAALLGEMRGLVDRMRGSREGAPADTALADLADEIERDGADGVAIRYVADADEAARIADRAAVEGMAVAIMPVAIASADAAAMTVQPGELADLRVRIDEVARRHRRARIVLIGGDDRPAPDLVAALEILRPDDAEAHGLLAGALTRAFGGDTDRFGRFLGVLRAGIPDDTLIALRGSAVQGQSYKTGEPFDAAGPGTSDLDVVLIGEAAMAAWSPDAFYLPSVSTKPLDDSDRAIAPSLDQARVEAQTIAGRPVSLQAMTRWFLDLRSMLQGTPYVILDG